MPQQIANINQRGVSKFFLRKKRAAFIVEFIDFSQYLKDLHTSKGLKESNDLSDINFSVDGMCGYFLKENMMYIDQEFAFQLEFLLILEVIAFELLLLVCFSWTTYFRIAVLDIRLLLLLFNHLLYH